MRSQIWIGIIDYGRLAWQRLIGRCKKSLDKRNRLVRQFRTQWCSNELFAHWFNEKPKWKLMGPNLSLG
jgi:hypothetical protein